jgi:hypothetical protein
MSRVLLHTHFATGSELERLGQWVTEYLRSAATRS